VNWPTRQETTRYTIFVIGFSLATAVFLGLLDFIFLQGLERFILNL
jgi:preprotein translocase subunit SecE